MLKTSKNLTDSKSKSLSGIANVASFVRIPLKRACINLSHHCADRLFVKLYANASPIRETLKQIQTKDKIIASACTAFVISNMDKVNISIAIMPMTQEFGWNSGAAGIIQSSFFAGYLLMQLPGGYFSTRLGGRRVLPIGLGTWSLATALSPVMAATLPTLALSRAMVGLGEAVAPTSIVDMIARIVRKEERASAVSLAFTGLHIGSIVGLLAAPALINAAGWRALFLAFGAAGLVWYIIFEALMLEVQTDDPETAAKLTSPMASSSTPDNESELNIPYRAFIRNRAVQALCFTHFANNWFHYTLLAWLPTYFTSVLNLEDLSEAAHTSLMPPIAGIICSLVAGPAADALIKSGWSVPLVRKVMQNIALLGPSACLLVACFLDGIMAGDKTLLVPLISLSLGLSSFSLAGLYCTHQDMSPKYAGAMLGLTNTTGAMAGVLSVSAVGIIYDHTSSWEAALLLPNIAIMLAGSLCFTLFGRNEAINFDLEDDSPLAVEKAIMPLKQYATSSISAAVHAVELLLPAPPKALVEAAKKARKAAELAASAMTEAADAIMHPRGDASDTATFSVTSMSSQQGMPEASSRQQAAYGTFGSGPLSTRNSFTSMVTTSLSGMQGRSSGSNSGPMLISLWTSASIMPDFDYQSSFEDAELYEAENEVERIMEEMRKKEGHH
ncbi:hypothetical protein CEUSTIGMA_g10818.t1 [Chlamydomonas eustigma]|uniref:Major facilitator superfamily (MFS) profile domain-containing protein n=1 Tax=Chlamydomonas eustigma TaxID=1157962 RepID=A0A250XK36_9CHLO|nr:hypothetical protein CEUSTIGMA_g10818.t1 [Chlamydomonas eustigma]|eukprot:GAX83393.1 hypothetical protein CEUSTIGMA_g10818.t1 [Chlamydomonas eustigma]